LTSWVGFVHGPGLKTCGPSCPNPQHLQNTRQTLKLCYNNNNYNDNNEKHK